jgi:hypothetical protein
MIRWGAVILGLAFVVVAAIYWLMPAGSLPAFFPGFEAGSEHVHLKHAVLSLAAAVVLFFIAWRAG